MAEQTLRCKTNANPLAAEYISVWLHPLPVSPTGSTRKLLLPLNNHGVIARLLNCLSSIWFWQRVSRCCSCVPFLIKDSQIVGRHFEQIVLSRWAAAASVLLTKQEAWLHQGCTIIPRCAPVIINSILQRLILILMGLLSLNVLIQSCNTQHWCFARKNQRSFELSVSFLCDSCP